MLPSKHTRRGAPSADRGTLGVMTGYRLLAVHAHPDDESSKGAATMEGSHKTHGAALGAAEIAATRLGLSWTHDPFELPETIEAAWRKVGKRGAKDRKKWEARLAAHPQAGDFTRAMAGDLPDGARDLAGLVDDELAVGGARREDHLGAGVRDLGGVRRGEPEGLGVVGDEEPRAVLGDADGHDVEPLAVDRGQDAGRRRAGHGVLARPTAEDDGDARTAGIGLVGHRTEPTPRPAPLR